MYNLIVLGTRPSAWTHEQFINWWRGEHAEPTYKLPGLLRWQHTDLQETFDDKSAGWDGLSVLSFESPEALKAALASPEWKAAVANVGDMGGRRMIWYGEEKTMVPLVSTS